MIKILLLLTTGLLSAPTLKKVVVLARHGNRSPDPEVPYVCPQFLNSIVPHFTPFTNISAHGGAALTALGVAENVEEGKWLRSTYFDQLGIRKEAYVDEGTLYFLAERMDRNVQSMNALALGLYPIGKTGMDELDSLAGGSKIGGSLVPILTTPPSRDSVLDAQDGGCKAQYESLTSEGFPKDLERSTIIDNLSLLKNLSTACNFDVLGGPKILYGKPFAWTIKAISDGLNMAKKEGISSWNLDGRLSVEDGDAVISLGTLVTNYNRFSTKKLATFWIGRFLEVVFSLLKKPVDKVYEFDIGVDASAPTKSRPFVFAKYKESMCLVESFEKSHIDPSHGFRQVNIETSSHSSFEDYCKKHAPNPSESVKMPFKDDANDFYNRSKMFVFLAHREPMISILKLFGLSEYDTHPLPTASMLVWELWEDEDESPFIKFKTWSPSEPSLSDRRKVLDTGKNKSSKTLNDLFPGGSSKEVDPSWCVEGREKFGKGSCTLRDFERRYLEWINTTGRWDKLCHLREVDDGLVELSHDQLQEIYTSNWHWWLKGNHWYEEL